MLTFFHKYFILHNIKSNKNYLQALRKLPTSLEDNEEFFIQMIKTHLKEHPNTKTLKRVLNLASNRLKNKEDFVEDVLVLTTMDNIEFASADIKNNENVMSLVVSRKSTLAKHMGQALRSNLDFAYTVLHYSVVGNEIRYFHGAIQNNYELALFSIKKYPKSYTYFSPNLKTHPEVLSIMKEHFKKHESYFSYLTKSLKNEPQFVLESLKENVKIYEFIGQKLKSVIDITCPIESLENFILRNKLVNNSTNEIKSAKRIKI